MDQIEDIIAKVFVRHADVFMAGGNHVKFPAAPSTAEWDDYSEREKSAGRIAAHSIIAALDVAGFVIVPKIPTNKMLLDADMTRCIDPAKFEAWEKAPKCMVARVMLPPEPVWTAMIEARPK